jgi:putative oxidoreductase
MTALGFMEHGVSKFFGIPPFPMPLNPLLYTAGTLELVGGGLFLLGLPVLRRGGGRSVEH